MVNPLIIPCRFWNSLKRNTLLIGCTILGSLLVESQAANPVSGNPLASGPAQNPSALQNSTATNPAARAAAGKLVLIPPGTVVDQKAPEGWSHLVLKSLPRISPTHQHLVAPSTYQLASLVFTSMVARVERVPGSNPAHYVLGDIGLGLGTKVQGHHMVLSPETQAQLGANLGFQERIVLSECHKRQALARSVVRTQTMAVFDTHAVMIRDGRHRIAKVRYAILLDPRSGQIATLCWGVDIDGQGRPFASNTALEWLPPNKVDQLTLYVDPAQITLGIPSGLAFAINQVPQGNSEIPLTSDLAFLTGSAKYTPQTAEELETQLRLELQRIIQKTAQKEPASRVAASTQPR